MTSGGARARSGPPPDPSALRRDRDHREWTELPAAGRAGEPPAWPLSRAAKLERELWAAEWRRPQALMWERNGQELEVALYVRTVKDATKTGAPASLRNLVRQQQESLGISLGGLARLRWRIVDQAASSPKVRLTATGTDGASIRNRLQVVTGGG